MPVRSLRRRAGASSRDDLVLDQMKADDPWPVPLVEVAAKGVPDHPLQVIQGIGLGVDGVAQRSGLIATIRRFLNRKYDFAFRNSALLVAIIAP